MSYRKIRYNKRSAKKYGWKPFWFQASSFDSFLIEKIKEFQKAHDLDPDGFCGPETYRRAFTEVENRIENENSELLISEEDSYIICNERRVKINWPKVKIDFLKKGSHKRLTLKRHPTMIVTHWDAALSARSCKNILESRKISTHFCIDNDGTIVQLLDTNHIGWHAGIRSVNKVSIGVDLSNAVYVKYNKTYEKRGFGLRPIIKGWKVHGRTIKPFLGFYPAQLEAYKILLSTLNNAYGIEMKCPLNSDGTLNTSVDKSASKGKFKGVVNHYNLTSKKWDALGLELDKIVKDITTN